jgi:hypothetical protein
MACQKSLEKVEVEYFGQKLMVFPWVNWIGTDKYGHISGFEFEPVKFKYPGDSWDNTWDIKEGDRWQCIKTGYAYQEVPEWENTLVKINH